MNDVTKGSTGVSIYFNMGYTATGLTAAAITPCYWRTRGAVTTFAATALASPTAAFTPGGWSEISAANAPGLYRMDVPDAAWPVGADGARSVTIGVKTATDFVVRNFLLTTVPNQVATGSLGGLPVSDANGYVPSKTFGYNTGVDPATLLLVNPGGKIANTIGGSVKVSGYDVGQDPGTYILVSPTYKLATDASGNVSVAGAGGGGIADWNTSQKNAIMSALGITFDGTTATNGPQLVRVNDYAAGMSPANQILLSTYRINTDASGNVSVMPVTLAAGAFASVAADGYNVLDLIRGIAAACLGTISFDPASLTGSVSAPGNPGAIKYTYMSDANLMTRTNVALTLNA
jgi:hypothetical protein